MRPVITKAVTALMLVLMVAATGAAREMSLDDCIELALKNRSSIIAARGAEQLAAAGQRTALGAFLPRASASYGYTKGKETGIDRMRALFTGEKDTILTYIVDGDTAKDFASIPTGYETNDEQDIGPSKSLTVSASLAVLDVGNWFGYAEARANREAARLDVINSEQDLIYAVKVSYYAYLAAVENVDVQQQAVARSEEQLKLIQSRYELGSAALSDVLKQKVQFGNDKLAFLRANNSVVTTKADLSYTIGLDPNEEAEFSTSYSVRAFEGTLDDAVTFGLGNEPGLLSVQKSLDAAKSGVKAGLSGYLPTVSLFANYNIFEGTQAYPETFDYSSNTLTYGFRVSFNIFDGFFRESSVTGAKVARNNAMAALSDTRNLVTRNVKTAYFEIDQQREVKQVAKENVDAATEDLKITQEKYNLGAATILDLLDAQVSVKQAQVALIQADFDLNLAIAKLEDATGRL